MKMIFYLALILLFMNVVGCIFSSEQVKKQTMMLERVNSRSQKWSKEYLGVEHNSEISFIESLDLANSGIIYKYKLDNGLTLLLWPDKAAPIFTYVTYYKVGSSWEQPGKTGLAHLLEHLMFRESKNLKPGEFDRLMEANGGDTNGATWLDWTYYIQTLPASKMELVVRLDFDRMVHAVIDDDAFVAERKVVINERDYRVENSAEGKMYEELYRTAFAVHPYGWPTVGFMADLEGFELADALGFYKTYYTPSNAVISIVGDFDIEEALTLINGYYGTVATKKITLPDISVEPKQEFERTLKLTLPVASEKLLLGYHIPGISHVDHPVVEILNHILFGGRSSRIYRRLQEEEEVAAEVLGWVGAFVYPSLWEMMITLKPGEDFGKVLAILDTELEQLIAEGITERELLGARNKLEAAFLRDHQDTESRAELLGHLEVSVGDYKKSFDLLKEYQEITREDVVRVASEILIRSNRTVVIAVPAVKGLD